MNRFTPMRALPRPSARNLEKGLRDEKEHCLFPALERGDASILVSPADEYRRDKFVRANGKRCRVQGEFLSVRPFQ
jgi:hypothetical protein